MEGLAPGSIQAHLSPLRDFPPLPLKDEGVWVCSQPLSLYHQRNPLSGILRSFVPLCYQVSHRLF